MTGASRTLPLRNIVALLAFGASQCSLFLHLSGLPSSAAGSGNPLRPTARSACLEAQVLLHTKKKDTAKAMSFFLAGAEGLEPSARGFGDRCSTN